MPLNPESIAQHLSALGYQAKAGSLTDKKSGEPQSVVFINGLGSINAYLNLSEDPSKFGLKVFGNLPEGYAPVVLDAQGEVLRETVTQNGQTITRAKRGEPLSPEALKRKNNEISLAARKEITAAVLAAYMLEVGGGDIEKIREGFRLQKWERSTQKPSAEIIDTVDVTPDASAEFNTVATTETSAEQAPSEANGRRKLKRGQSLSM